MNDVEEWKETVEWSIESISHLLQRPTDDNTT